MPPSQRCLLLKGASFSKMPPSQRCLLLKGASFSKVFPSEPFCSLFFDAVDLTTESYTLFGFFSVLRGSVKKLICIEYVREGIIPHKPIFYIS